jgi:hypothetical protein
LSSAEKCRPPGIPCRLLRFFRLRREGINQNLYSQNLYSAEYPAC